MAAQNPIVSQENGSSIPHSENVWRTATGFVFNPNKVVFPKRCIVTGVESDVVLDKTKVSFFTPKYKVIEFEIPISAAYKEKQDARRRVGWRAFWIGIAMMCTLTFVA